VSIVRGFLAYSNEAGDGVAASMIDSVIFLEGTQSGSHLAFDITRSSAASRFSPVLSAVATTIGTINPARPAIKELTPKSQWFLWTNPNPNHVPNIPYFNVYGDINVSQLNCFFFVANCKETTVLKWGDVVVLPGDSSSPQAVPPGGGARFLNGPRGVQNWEWSMPGTVYWDPNSDPSMTGVDTQLVGQPQYHGSFGRNIASIQIPDCQTGSSVSVRDELTLIVIGRETNNPYQCRP
jgi:hypothetical protein